MSDFNQRVENATDEAVSLVETFITERGHGDSEEYPIPLDIIHDVAMETSDSVPSVYTSEVWEDWTDQRAWEHADEFSSQFGIPIEEWKTGDGRQGMEAFAVCVLQEIAHNKIEATLYFTFDIEG